MDPDATLAELRLLVEALQPRPRGDPRPVAVPLQERRQVAQETLVRVLELWGALDASLASGGRLPCDWAR